MLPGPCDPWALVAMLGALMAWESSGPRAVGWGGFCETDQLACGSPARVVADQSIVDGIELDGSSGSYVALLSASL